MSTNVPILLNKNNGPPPLKMQQISLGGFDSMENSSPGLVRPKSQAYIPLEFSSPTRKISGNSSINAEDSSPRLINQNNNNMNKGPMQGFSTLRKKVTKNNFQLDLTPVGQMQHPYEN